MYKVEILAWLCWIVGLILLGRAMKLWREADRHAGYAEAMSEIEEYQSRAVAERLARQAADAEATEN